VSEPSVPPSESPAREPSDVRPRLAAFIDANFDRYSEEALAAAARQAGYLEPEVRRAIQAASARRRSGTPGTRARWIVIGAYLVTYLILSAGLLIPQFAVPYDLARPSWYVLTAAIALALLGSLLLMRRATTTAALLGAPLALLAVVGGLCVHTTGTPFGLLR
jgi:hypothetical protein